MIVNEHKNYTLITSEKSDFSDFFSIFEEKHAIYKEKHLIIKISDNINTSKENILLFLSYADEHQNNGTSFVIILKDVNIDDYPETFNIVPSLTEAEDVIEMENIQRDLGF
ncbi:MAG: hypothetical protein ACPGU6_03060 [Tenacibaculum sp.]